MAEEIVAKKITDFYKLPGVIDIHPMKARGEFARALMLEHNAGKTTAEAEAALQRAIDLIEGD